MRRVTAAEIERLQAEIERLQAEHQAVLDCINLYGDETLHSALDGIGWPTAEPGKRALVALDREA